MCEIPGCPQPVAEVVLRRPTNGDERAHLCPGHAYALVMCIEHNTEERRRWFTEWTWAEPIDGFLNLCRVVAEAHREQLLEWRRNNRAN